MSPDPGTRRASCAVIPAAGFATRFLPATKTVPKELLPVVDRPVLQYVVEEAVAAGLTGVLLVTGRGKGAMVDHFDRRPDLEAVLEAKGDQARLAAIRRPAELTDLFTVRQPEMRGLGHAVGCAEAHVAGQPFAVLLPDEFTEPGSQLLPEMLELQQQTGGIVLMLIEVSDEDVSRYGIASVEPAGAEPDGSPVVRVTGMVEKPPLAEAASRLAVVGRYVLPPGIFEAIRRTKPGTGGEIQLTDAMALMLEEGAPVHGVVYRGTRYDTGVPLGYLQAVVQLACQRDDLGAEFRRWLTGFLAGAGRAGGGPGGGLAG